MSSEPGLGDRTLTMTRRLSKLQTGMSYSTAISAGLLPIEVAGPVMVSTPIVHFASASRIADQCREAKKEDGGLQNSATT
ncbi:hypothetical protein ABIB66_008212 [Bradyrhizobium sp. F1.13.3]